MLLGQARSGIEDSITRLGQSVGGVGVCGGVTKSFEMSLLVLEAKFLDQFVVNEGC